MALAYTKWSAEEDKKRNLLDEGAYSALIVSIEESLTKEKFNKDGQAIPRLKMLVIDFVINHQGRERRMKGWIMLEGDMSWQFRHLCQSAGLIDKYEQDCIDINELKNKNVILDIKIKNQKDQSGNDVIRNVINDYLVAVNTKPSALKPLTGAKNDFVNDDIPF